VSSLRRRTSVLVVRVSDCGRRRSFYVVRYLRRRTSVRRSYSDERTNGKKKKKKKRKEKNVRTAHEAQKRKDPPRPRSEADPARPSAPILKRGRGKAYPGHSSAPSRFTRIDVVLGVRGEDPAEAARSYGRLNAWLYPTLGFLDRFLYLDFEQFRLLPDFSSAEPTVKDHVSFRVTARAYAIVFTLLRVLYAFWREKVLDVFI